MEWRPGKNVNKKWIPQAYNVVWLKVVAIIPLTVMVVSYTRVVYRL